MIKYDLKYVYEHRCLLRWPHPGLLVGWSPMWTVKAAPNPGGMLRAAASSSRSNLLLCMGIVHYGNSPGGNPWEIMSQDYYVNYVDIDYDVQNGILITPRFSKLRSGSSKQQPPSVATSKKRRSLYILCCISLVTCHACSDLVGGDGEPCVIKQHQKASRKACCKYMLSCIFIRILYNHISSYILTQCLAMHSPWCDILPGLNSRQGAVRSSKPPPAPARWLKSRRQLLIT